MAYNKKNWQDNVSDVTAAELNRMEQGIYDNSLVSDAITNKLNPTDTETYKTAELTEGQITDVIGVNDIVIKGDTEQDGTPTPSAPVDVNVVSGSNVINASSKNLMDKDREISQGSTTSDTGTDRISIRVKQKLKANTTYTVITNLNTSNFQWAFVLGTKVSPWAPNQQIYDSQWKTTKYFSYTTTQESYLNIPIRKPSNADINVNDVKDYWFMLYEGAYDSNVSYEPHQGKELPLDLPVENLFDKNNYVAGQVYSNNTITANTPWGIFYLPCIIGETYIISGLKTYSGTQIVQCNSNKQFILNLVTRSTENTEYTVTATQNGYIGISFVWSASASKGSELDTINIKKAGTDPIELCKIGNYQDYFYKSGSKWYLHKEIEKVILNGNENWEQYSGNNNVFFAVINSSIMPLPKNESLNVFCDNYVSVLSTSSVTTFIDEASSLNYAVGVHVTSSVIRIKDTRYTSVVDLKSWLASNNVTLYYVLATATNTEITDTTLISQLEAIYNAPLYEETNITQTNNDLPMVLDITACKDNINGIKAFIRK